MIDEEELKLGQKQQLLDQGLECCSSLTVTIDSRSGEHTAVSGKASTGQYPLEERSTCNSQWIFAVDEKPWSDSVIC